MENPLGNIIIQSIRVGSIGGSQTMQWTVGHTVTINKKSFVISSIVRSEAVFHYSGVLAYLVYGKTDEGDEKLLKAYENQPVSLSIEI
jgi:hypothetical protein